MVYALGKMQALRGFVKPGGVVKVASNSNATGLAETSSAVPFRVTVEMTL